MLREQHCLLKPGIATWTALEVAKCSSRIVFTLPYRPAGLHELHEVFNP